MCIHNILSQKHLIYLCYITLEWWESTVKDTSTLLEQLIYNFDFLFQSLNIIFYEILADTQADNN